VPRAANVAEGEELEMDGHLVQVEDQIDEKSLTAATQVGYI
jgi:hypothetical protein